MKIVNTYPIGTEVYYFDPMLEGDCEIKKNIVLGSFVHKSEGELFYFLLGKQVEGYAVYDNEQEAKEMRDIFMLYRKELLKANEENKKRFAKVRNGKVFEEFDINHLPNEEDLNKGEDYDKPTHSANDA